MNEKALIKRCRHGDREAFDELIRLYYDYVSGFLLKATENETLCEDLTQETFLKMIRSIEKFEPDGSAAFGTWLITIAKNCYIDHLRRNRIHFEDIETLQPTDEKKRGKRSGAKAAIRAGNGGYESTPARAGAGNQAEICRGYDPRTNCRALRRTAENR